MWKNAFLKYLSFLCCYVLTRYSGSIFRLYLDSGTTFFIGSSELIHLNHFTEISEICKDVSTGGGQGGTAAVDTDANE